MYDQITDANKSQSLGTDKQTETVLVFLHNEQFV